MKRRTLLAGAAFAVLIAVFVAGGWKAVDYHQAMKRDHGSAFRALIAADAGLEPDDGELDIARKLAALLYSRTRWDVADAFVETNSDPLRYALTVTGEMANYCDSLTYTLIWMLGLFDIPARPIHFATEDYLTGVRNTDTHTMVEALIDGRPVAIDPTFNTVYHEAGSEAPVGAAGMYELAKAGRLQWSYYTPPRPQRAIEEYYLPFDKLMAAVSASARSDVFPAVELPRKGWLAEARY